MGNNANCGPNSWKDRPYERNFIPLRRNRKNLCDSSTCKCICCFWHCGSPIKGGGVARRLQCSRSLEPCRGICQATPRGKIASCRNSTVRKYEPRATRGLPSHTPWEQGFCGLRLVEFRQVASFPLGVAWQIPRQGSSERMH
ncbi:hypothetical protein AVEN_164969-1 [Araneus ventricosus]|uniref:Uncharacterized protein n=1 Tax=Araneus ventricosus TaxID=182803 RepID=A0A4Y2WXF9_ARAVE|nr:hypothetical protein AVEN_164969-1 [Araneus ventricosus]